MKALFSLLLICIISTNNFGQSSILKDAYSISGNISFSSTSTENSSDSRSEFIFNPSAGYFFINNFYTGISINYYSVTYGGNSSSNYGFGPTLKYFFDANDKLKPFVGLSYYYAVMGSESDIVSTNLSISGGVDLFITNSFALEGSANYSFISYDLPKDYYPNDQDSKRFSISIGVNYFIR